MSASEQPNFVSMIVESIETQQRAQEMGAKIAKAFDSELCAKYTEKLVEVSRGDQTNISTLIAFGAYVLARSLRHNKEKLGLDDKLTPELVAHGVVEAIFVAFALSDEAERQGKSPADFLAERAAAQQPVESPFKVGDVVRIKVGDEAGFQFRATGICPEGHVIAPDGTHYRPQDVQLAT